MEENTYVQKKDNGNGKNIAIGLLAFALLGTWGYIIYDKNETKALLNAKENVITNTVNERDVLKKELDNATLLYDEMKTQSAQMEHSKDSIITQRDREINEKRNKIQTILSKTGASSSELAQAKQLISSLQNDIASYRSDIERLEGEKMVLTQERDKVITEREEEKKKVEVATKTIAEKEAEIDIASTLTATNFYIVGINEKRGGKEKETTTAKRVDKFRISFDIAENRVSKSGTKKVFVIVTAPDGKVVTSTELGSGQFTTRENETKDFTQNLEINYTQGQRQTVSVDWRTVGDYLTGDYKVEVFENGFKIGEAVKSLKKGGLFS